MAEASIVDDGESGAVDRVWSGCEGEGALGRERQSAMAMEGGKTLLLAATLPESPKFVPSFGDGESNFIHLRQVSEAGFGRLWS